MAKKNDGGPPDVLQFKSPRSQPVVEDPDLDDDGFDDEDDDDDCGCGCGCGHSQPVGGGTSVIDMTDQLLGMMDRLQSCRAHDTNHAGEPVLNRLEVVLYKCLNQVTTDLEEVWQEDSKKD